MYENIILCALNNMKRKKLMILWYRYNYCCSIGTISVYLYKIDDRGTSELSWLVVHEDTKWQSNGRNKYLKMILKIIFLKIITIYPNYEVIMHICLL